MRARSSVRTRCPVRLPRATRSPAPGTRCAVLHGHAAREETVSKTKHGLRQDGAQTAVQRWLKGTGCVGTLWKVITQVGKDTAGASPSAFTEMPFLPVFRQRRHDSPPECIAIRQLCNGLQDDGEGDTSHPVARRG